MKPFARTFGVSIWKGIITIC